jgi:hypothetical protein
LEPYLQVGALYPQVGSLYLQVGALYPQVGSLYPQVGFTCHHPDLKNVKPLSHNDMIIMNSTKKGECSAIEKRTH